MKKAHPVYGQFRGKSAFGIRRIAVIAPRLRTVVEKCDLAAKSADARDKNFLSCELGWGWSGGGSSRFRIEGPVQSAGTLATSIRAPRRP